MDPTNAHYGSRYPYLDAYLDEPPEEFDWEAYRAAFNPELQSAATTQTITASSTAERSQNQLRPVTFKDIVGQEKVKALLARMVEVAQRRDQPLDHVLLVGPSGTGKTTLATIIAHEMGRDVYQVEAPVSIETLEELRTTMQDGDVLFIDEIHMQAQQDRRGASASMSPETFYNVLEDRTLIYGNAVLPFPAITCVGATTDEGLLPQPFLNRFPIRPRLQKYTEDEMVQIALNNAAALDLQISDDVARRFARASRGVPRQINNFVKNGAMLDDERITDELASEILHDLNDVTDDGLTRDMVDVLIFLYQRARRERGDGMVTYQASIATLATAIGKNRDVKALQLYVEPHLIQEGLLQVSGGGRMLTDAGIVRALELIRREAR